MCENVVFADYLLPLIRNYNAITFVERDSNFATAQGVPNISPMSDSMTQIALYLYLFG